MFKFLEKTIEFFSVIKIALSPILVFTLTGIMSYFSLESPLNFILGIGLTLLGLVLGVWWVIYICKKNGAVEFNAYLHSTPELDNKEKK